MKETNSEAGDDWKICVKGTYYYGYEISICRSSFLHGFESYGWDGEQKIILFEVKKKRTIATPLWDVLSSFAETKLVEFAQAAADAMNAVEKSGFLKDQPH